MLKIGKLADYALVLADNLKRQDGIVSIRELSKMSEIPLATVRKILLQLSRQGIVNSYRGTSGGYELARSAEQISIAEVIEALEGPISLTECVSINGDCKLQENCPLQSGWTAINSSILNTLSSTSLADL